VVTEEYAGSVFLCLLLKLRTAFRKVKKKGVENDDPICLGLQKFWNTLPTLLHDPKVQSNGTFTLLVCSVIISLATYRKCHLCGAAVNFLVFYFIIALPFH